MTPRERGFLLLASHLGDPNRKVLTTAQLRVLADRVSDSEKKGEERALFEKDLTALGFGRELARQIVDLLGEEARLDAYLNRGRRMDCTPITRVSREYPLILRQRLGLDSPGCLWAKGNVELLNTPAIALVGSRELGEPNREFAAEAGRQAAKQGLTLVSGNARGADRAAQEACLNAGGNVISIVADALNRQPRVRNVLFLSEGDYDGAFSAQRALSRNRCIHALGRIVFVAQSELGKGGTWDGTVKNLRFGWSPVACFRDGSESARRLEQMGAYLVGGEDLGDLGALLAQGLNFYTDSQEKFLDFTHPE